jgi:mono/diheme cytochrome c family protein
VFDDFGASILADASGGDNHGFTHVSIPFEYPHKPKAPARVLNRGRPTAGCEIISSRHFPEEVQGTFLVNQSIGFHGTRWDRLTPQGSTWEAEPMPADLLSSADVNFRPVAMEIGPDGALYIVDWCNPIVGHMQYSVRDPRRDHSHGRVWRVRHRTRDLVQPVNVHDASVADLLGYLRLPERNTRHHARLRLQRMAWTTVGPALATWRNTLDPAGPLYARLKLEDLWIRHAHGRAGPEAIERVLALDEPRARAGAVRVLRYQLQAEEIDVRAAVSLLAAAVEDLDMRVRLEGVVACGFLPAADGVRLAARADLHEMDEAMGVVFEEVLSYLGRGGDVVSDVLERVRLTRMPADELLATPLADSSAIARLSRADLPLDRRVEALTHLAGSVPSAQAARLVSLLETLRGAEVLRSLGVLLLSMPDQILGELGIVARRLVEDPDPVRRSIGLAIQLTRGDVFSGASPQLVDAVALMEAGRVPAETLATIRSAVEQGEIDPWPAIGQIVRHDRDQDGVRDWLAVLAETVENEPIDDWTADHERAMAALRAMATMPEWPGFDRYRIDAAPADVLAAGREIYHDEVRGCVRCHGPHGQGLEGYPPLDRSPWLVGAPRRAAAIVVHGLYGPLEMPDGREFNSAMEPIGGILEDREIAAVLTYVRQSWGNFAPPVTQADVTAARDAAPEGGGMWEAGGLALAHPLYRDALVATPIASTDGSIRVLRAVVIFLGVPLLIAVLTIVLLERRSKATPASGPAPGG